jgi:hypothetical protein
MKKCNSFEVPNVLTGEAFIELGNIEKLTFYKNNHGQGVNKDFFFSGLGKP